MYKKIVLILITFCFLFSSGCGNRTERNIKNLEGNKEQRDQSMMELAMAKEDAVPDLIAALKNKNKKTQVRTDIVTILYRILLREGNETILQAFLENLKETEPEIRSHIVMALGDLREKKSIDILLSMTADENAEVRDNTLCALDNMKDKMNEKQKDVLLEGAKCLINDENENVKEKAKEIVVAEIGKMTNKAQEYVLKADLDKAEKILLEAKTLMPDSLNANYKLARFYYDNEQKEKGLEILKKYNMAIYVKKLEKTPVIDGDLGDDCWRKAVRISNFYKCLRGVYSAKAAESKTEVFLGYTDTSLYIGGKSYEKNIKDIRKRAKNRDGEIWKDDCYEIFIDTNHDYSTYYQIVINSIGTIYDGYKGVKDRGSDKKWNGDFKAAGRVGKDYWSMEIEIPFDQLHNAKIEKGTIWGFNINRFLGGTTSESAQWVPTYGNHHRSDLFGFLIFD